MNDKDTCAHYWQCSSPDPADGSVIQYCPLCDTTKIVLPRLLKTPPSRDAGTFDFPLNTYSQRKPKLIGGRKL